MIRAIVEEAAKHDLGVFAHITSLDELQATLAGGAAGVVHTVWDRPFPDADLADRMAARKFYVIPTTSVYRGTVSLHYIDEPIDLDTPQEALEAAAKRAAEMLDAEDEFGTIEPGKRADLLILGANPLDDIRNTRSLETVIAEGRVVDRDALSIKIP